MIRLRKLFKFQVILLRSRNIPHLSAQRTLPVDLRLLLGAPLFFRLASGFPLLFYAAQRLFFHFLALFGRADRRPLALDLPLLLSTYFFLRFGSLCFSFLSFGFGRFLLRGRLGGFPLRGGVQHTLRRLDLFNLLNIVQHTGRICFVILFDIGRMHIFLRNPGHLPRQLLRLRVLMEPHNHIILHRRHRSLRPFWPQRLLGFLIVFGRRAAVFLFDSPQLRLVFIPVLHQVHLILI